MKKCIMYNVQCTINDDIPDKNIWGLQKKNVVIASETMSSVAI